MPIKDGHELKLYTEGNVLCFASVDYSKLSVLYKIPIGHIEYFDRYGDFYTETNVSGGGSSVKGAVVGSIVAGEMGATIGSRKKIETKTEIVDKRQTIMYINDSAVRFDSDAFDIFMDVIPKKEINHIKIQNSVEG